MSLLSSFDCVFILCISLLLSVVARFIKPKWPIVIVQCVLLCSYLVLIVVDNVAWRDAVIGLLILAFFSLAFSSNFLKKRARS